MTIIQQQIDFTVHSHERTRESEVILNAKRSKLGGNCKLLIQYWQKNHFWLSDDDARRLLGVRNITQRVADIRHLNNIPVESKVDERGNFKVYRLKCTCKVIGGNDVVIGCYVHDPSKRV